MLDVNGVNERFIVQSTDTKNLVAYTEHPKQILYALSPVLRYVKSTSEFEQLRGRQYYRTLGTSNGVGSLLISS